jgi:alkylation response protein AidB-like acyl-CoA dehydrogenase
MNLSQVLTQVDQIASSIVASDAERVDRDAAWPEAGLRALQRAGLGGLVAPTASGGLGLGFAALTLVCERLGQHCASTALCFGMHCVGTAVIAAKATATQRQQYLEPIARGEHLTTLALSEPGTGIHFYLPRTTLARTADGAYVLNGSKTFVTNGGYADSYVVSTVAAEADAPIGQFSCVLVPADAPDIAWGEAWNGLGMRGNASRELALRGTRIRGDHLIGEEGDQIWYVFEVVAPFFLLAMAGSYLGIASAALDRARRHLSDRQYAHRGRALGSEPVLQHRLGAVWARLESTRRLVYHAASELDAGSTGGLCAVLAAKAEVAECVVEVVNEAMTLTGGIGYRMGGAMSRHLRDARAAHVMAPTTDILRTWTGRALLDLPLLAD